MISSTGVAHAVNVDDGRDKRVEKAQQLLQLNVDNGMLNTTLALTAKAILPLLTRNVENSLKRRVTPEEQIQFGQGFVSFLGQILDGESFINANAQIYANHFTLAELEAIHTFNLSQTGSKFQRMQSTLARESSEALQNFMKSKSQEINKLSEELIKKVFPELLKKQPTQ